MSFESSLVWVEPRSLCFGEKPGRWRTIEQDLDFLRSQRVKAIVSLREEEPELETYRRLGFFAANIPVKDFRAPSQDQIEECMKTLEEHRRKEISAYIHCYAGIGRSGTMAAAWLIHCGKNPTSAIQTIRRLKQGTIESEEQYNALLEYAARCFSEGSGKSL